MAVSLHTLGDWRVAPDGVTIHVGPLDDPIIVGSAEVDDVMAIDDESEKEANAKLFAAAPSHHLAIILFEKIMAGHLNADGSWTPLCAAEQRVILDTARVEIAKVRQLASADPFLKMRPIRVHYDDGQVEETNINGTRREIEAYYIGQAFEFDESKPTHTAVRVEFLEGGVA